MIKLPQSPVIDNKIDKAAINLSKSYYKSAQVFLLPCRGLQCLWHFTMKSCHTL